ncbi:MAG: hypothetical protein KGH98_01260 [Candidatus Micrarchaeota archaeon]|nr:hypothetical protein [Candidatus Micrarchaeota archaeon]
MDIKRIAVIVLLYLVVVVGVYKYVSSNYTYALQASYLEASIPAVTIAFAFGAVLTATIQDIMLTKDTKVLKPFFTVLVVMAVLVAIYAMVVAYL